MGRGLLPPGLPGGFPDGLYPSPLAGTTGSVHRSKPDHIRKPQRGGLDSWLCLLPARWLCACLSLLVCKMGEVRRHVRSGGSPGPEGTLGNKLPQPRSRGPVGHAGDRGWDTAQPSGLYGREPLQGLARPTNLHPDGGPIFSALATCCARLPYFPIPCSGVTPTLGTNFSTRKKRCSHPPSKKKDFLEAVESREPPLPAPRLFSCMSFSRRFASLSLFPR